MQDIRDAAMQATKRECIYDMSILIIIIVNDIKLALKNYKFDTKLSVLIKPSTGNHIRS